MINTFAQVDQYASAGHTPWHRASAISKLLFAFATILLAVFTTSAPALAGYLVVALALALSARLPLRLVLLAATTPLFFAALWLVSRWTGRPDEIAMTALRPVIASLIALWLVGTTPYPDLFAPLSRVMPRVVGDSLFLTYRAVFALLQRLERLWRALFLRGALGGTLRARGQRMGEAVGTVVLYGFERSQRLYQVMHLRGHSGRICGCRHWRETRAEDMWVVVAFAAVLASRIVLGR